MPADPIEFEIRPYDQGDRADVVALWVRTDLIVPGNDPHRDIDRKLADSADWFFVGQRGRSLVATVMVGYDGHRGWINYLAVDPSEQGTGVGAAMMLHAEQVLRDVGCVKINLQVRTSNEAAIGFYRTIGYEPDDVVSLGLRLVDDVDDVDGGSNRLLSTNGTERGAVDTGSVAGGAVDAGHGTAG